MEDEPKVEQLENRIDKLESTIEKMMPSRRDALKMGGAALVGGAAMSGTASAGSNQVGTIGDKDASPPKRVDLHSEDINNADTVTTQTLDAVSIDTDTISVDETRNINASLLEAYGGAPTPSSITVTETKVGDVVVGEFSMQLTGSASESHRWQIDITNTFLTVKKQGVGSAFLYDSISFNNNAFYDIVTNPFDEELFLFTNKIDGSLNYSEGIFGTYTSVV